MDTDDLGDGEAAREDEATSLPGRSGEVAGSGEEAPDLGSEAGCTIAAIFLMMWSVFPKRNRMEKGPNAVVVALELEGNWS